MTVSTLLNRVSYAGNGVTTVFSFPNRFLADADIVVYQKVDATAVSTLKALTTDYTLTGAGDAAGGNVTMLVAPPTGTTLIIYRDPALTQPIDLVNGDPLDVETGVERAFDRSTLQIQRLADLGERSLRLNDSDTSGASTELPIPVATRILGWNAAGTAIENKVPADLALTPVTTFIATLLDDADAATACATLNAQELTDTTISDVAVQVSAAGTGNRYAVVDLVGDDTYPDFGLRVIRANTGPNTTSAIQHRGTGNLLVSADDAGTIHIMTNSVSRIIADSSGNVILRATLVSQKAADSGFTRITPNFSMRTDVMSLTSLTRDGYTAISIPSGATALLIYVVADAKSNNAVASRYTVVQGQQQTGSLETSPGHGRVLAMTYEHVAVSAATILTTADGWIILPAATPYLTMYDDSGNQGTAAYQVRGYWD